MATVEIRVVGRNYATRTLREVERGIWGITRASATLGGRIASITGRMLGLSRAADRAQESMFSLSVAFKWYMLWYGIWRVQSALSSLVEMGIQAVKEFELGTFAMENLIARQIRETTALKERILVGKQRVQLTREEREELERLEIRLRRLRAQAALEAGVLQQAAIPTEAERRLREARLAEYERQIRLAEERINRLRARESQEIPVYKTIVRYTMSQEEALTRAKEQAKQLYMWTVRTAILSPFSKEGVKRALLTALAYGMSVEQAQRLTEASLNWTAAMGESQDLAERINRSLGQALARGKITAEEIRELAHAGIPVTRWLAEFLQVATPQEVYKTVRSGAVSASEAVEYIMQRMEESYRGTIERMAETTPGLVESVRDTLKEVTRPFFQGLIEPFKPFMKQFVDRMVGEDAEIFYQRLEQFRVRTREVVQGILDITTGLTRLDRVRVGLGLFRILGVEDQREAIRVGEIYNKAVDTLKRMFSVLGVGKGTLQEVSQFWERIRANIKTLIEDSERLGTLLGSLGQAFVITRFPVMLRLVSFGLGLVFNRMTLLTGALYTLSRAWETNWGNIMGLVDRVRGDFISLYERLRSFLVDKLGIDLDTVKEKMLSLLPSEGKIDFGEVYDRAKEGLEQYLQRIEQAKQKVVNFIDQHPQLQLIWDNLNETMSNVWDTVNNVFDSLKRFGQQWQDSSTAAGQVREALGEMVDRFLNIATYASAIVRSLSELPQVVGEGGVVSRALTTMIRDLNTVLSLLERGIYYFGLFMGADMELVRRRLEYADKLAEYRRQVREGVLPPTALPPMPPEKEQLLRAEGSLARYLRPGGRRPGFLEGILPSLDVAVLLGHLGAAEIVGRAVFGRSVIRMLASRFPQLALMLMAIQGGRMLGGAAADVVIGEGGLRAPFERLQDLFGLIFKNPFLIGTPGIVETLLGMSFLGILARTSLMFSGLAKAVGVEKIGRVDVDTLNVFRIWADEMRRLFGSDSPVFQDVMRFWEWLGLINREVDPEKQSSIRQYGQAWYEVSGAIGTVGVSAETTRRKLSELHEQLQQLQLPPDFQRRSPSPAEQSFMGVTSAVKTLTSALQGLGRELRTREVRVSVDVSGSTGDDPYFAYEVAKQLSTLLV